MSGRRQALPLIEVLMVRDPDMATDVYIWLDGVDVTDDCYVVDVDPGAGHEYDDWVESGHAAAAGATSDAARAKIAETYDDPPAREYIEGWPDDD